jgi:hypothetical protein
VIPRAFPAVARVFSVLASAQTLPVATRILVFTALLQKQPTDRHTRMEPGLKVDSGTNKGTPVNKRASNAIAISIGFAFGGAGFAQTMPQESNTNPAKSELLPTTRPRWLPAIPWLAMRRTYAGPRPVAAKLSIFVHVLI